MKDTKYWLPLVRHDISKKMESFSRIEAGNIIGLITGHCAIGKHLARAKLLEEGYNPKVCRLCNKEVEDDKTESIQHWIEECSKTIQARFRSFGTMLPAKIKGKWTVNTINRFCKSEGIKSLFREDIKVHSEETDSNSDTE